MKKLLLFFIALIGLHQAYTQDYKDKVKKRFNEYTSSLVKKDFIKSAEYINPAFFSILPKQQLIQVMESTFNNPDMEFLMENPEILEVGDKKVINKENYTKIRYSQIIKMRFKMEETDSASTDEIAQRYALIKSSLEQQFGAENVKFDEATRYYSIYSEKNVVANAKDDSSWTFVVIEEKQKSLLQKFIPKEML